MDSAALTARTAVPATGMGCVACHAYPPDDSNHLYHLGRDIADKRINGLITCLDCHNQSLAAREEVMNDTFYHDPDPASRFPGDYSTVDFPVTGTVNPPPLLIRSWHLDSVIIRRQRHPLQQPGRAPTGTGLAEFMTGLAHLNDSIDVVFDPNVSDTARFLGARAAYNPREETCSAVACHQDAIAYRFASKAKGLPGSKE